MNTVTSDKAGSKAQSDSEARTKQNKNKKPAFRRCRREDKIELIYIMDGAKTTQHPLENGRATDDTTLAYKFLRMAASHFVLLCKEVSWNPLALLLLKLGWSNTSEKQKHST